MEYFLGIHDTNLIDLSVYQCGTHDCEPDHSFGPAVRDHFLIHYILEGEGVFQFGEKTYHLKKNQGFLICPEQITFYKANSTRPWHYTWVSFNGTKARKYLDMAGLGEHNPIFTCKDDVFIRNCFLDMLSTKSMSSGKEIRLTGILYLFLSQLVEVFGPIKTSSKISNRKDIYITKTIEFIKRNFSLNISISDIAGNVNLDRSYLGSIFKEEVKMSIQEYLINFRINKAVQLLKTYDLSISDISRSVGYQDPMLFSKMFKKICGMSPSQYRKIQ